MIAGTDDEHGLHQPPAFELSYSVSNLGHVDRFGETVPSDSRDLVDRGMPVAAVEHDRSERLQTMRLLRLRVVDHGLVADRLDQQSL